MLFSVRIENFLVYSASVDFSLLADKRRRFDGSIAESAGFSVLKSACIYGANNVGKSCTLRAIRALKSILSGEKFPLVPNLFSDNTAVSLGVSFTADDKAYSFDFTYDNKTENGDINTGTGVARGFIYQRFAEYSGEKRREKELYLIDRDEGVFSAKGVAVKDRKGIENALKTAGNESLAPFLINNEVFNAYANILIDFAERIEFVDMSDISLAKTVKTLKENGETAALVREFLKQADLEIEDFYYDPDYTPTDLPTDTSDSLFSGVEAGDLMRLIAVRRGKQVQSYVYDSKGTKKIIAAASYIIESLTSGKILVVDELDAGLHFKLTRAVVALFNNALNEKAQLIFTTHDVTLLDCKTLFRKDQIWFAAKDKDGEYLYALSDFCDSGETPDSFALIKKYRDGMLGALPKPDLVSVILKKEDEEQ